jgi:hypothetical protein
MTATIEHVTSSQFNGSGASPSGSLTTSGTNRLVCIAAISGRANTGTDYQTLSAISASGLTFTHKVSQQFTYSDSVADPSFPVNSFTIDIWTAPAAAQLTALAFTSTMTGDGFVNNGTFYTWAVAGLQNIASPFDTNNVGIDIATGTTNGTPTVVLSTDQPNDTLVGLFMSHTQGGSQAGAVVGSGWTSQATVNGTSGAGNGTKHTSILQSKAVTVSQSSFSAAAGYTDDKWVSVVLAFRTDAATSVLVSELASEVLNQGATTNIRTSEIAAEVLNRGAATNVLVSEVAVEALSTVAAATTMARVSEIAVEALSKYNNQTFDGTQIKEIYFGIQSDFVYLESDYDSIYSRGDRIANGLITTGVGGTWASGGNPQFVDAAFDNNFSFAAGDGTNLQGGSNLYPGAFMSITFQGGNFVDVRGLKWVGQDHIDLTGYTWTITGGFDISFAWWIVPGGTHEFTLTTASTGHDYQGQFEFDPQGFLYWPYYQIAVSEFAASVPSTRFCNELWLKVNHSNLDGGDRRNLGGTRPDKWVIVSHSTGIETQSGAGFDADAGIVDGKYLYSNRDSFFNPTSSTVYRDASTHGVLNTAGQYIQYQFPRAVAMQEMVWVIDDSQPEVYSSGNPTKYGTWQWQASALPTSGYVNVGSPWKFNAGSTFMVTPNPTVGLPSVPPQYQFWRQVLVTGPALNLRLYQAVFNLYDPGNAQNLYFVSFSDDTDAVEIIPTVTTVPSPPSNLSITFSDGETDALNATATVLANLSLTIAFTDDADFETFSDLYPSNYVQSFLVTTGT